MTPPKRKALVPILIAAAAVIGIACTRYDSRDQQPTSPSRSGAMDDAALTTKVKTADHRSVGDAITDAALTASVKTSLAVERGVKASDIDVDTSYGVVTLNGRVRSGAEARLAERTTRKVSGVREVVNHLRVSSS